LNAYDDGKEPPGLVEIGSDNDDDDNDDDAAKPSGKGASSRGLGEGKNATSAVVDNEGKGKQSTSGGVKRQPSGNKKGGGPKKKPKTEKTKKKTNTSTSSKKKNDLGIGVHHKSCLDKGTAHKPFKSKNVGLPRAFSLFPLASVDSHHFLDSTTEQSRNSTSSSLQLILSPPLMTRKDTAGCGSGTIANSLPLPLPLPFICFL